jgi:hypothetical protein
LFSATFGEKAVIKGPIATFFCIKPGYFQRLQALVSVNQRFVEQIHFRIPPKSTITLSSGLSLLQ